MFIWFAFGWIFATLILFQQAFLPSPVLLVWGLSWGILAQSFGWPRLGQALIGLVMGGLALILMERATPPLAYMGPDDQAIITGQIVSLVTEQHRFGHRHQRATFAIHKLAHQDPEQVSYTFNLRPRQVQLNCWRCPQLKPNHTYQLKVKLQPLRGLSNPGVFDYEAWAKQQGLDGRARVIMTQSDWDAPSWSLGRRIGIHDYRNELAKRMRHTWRDSPFAGIYSGLLLADRAAITDQQWQVMRKTGTIHLMAISGLHLALVAAIGYSLGAMIWWFVVGVLHRWTTWPRVWVAVPISILCATAYAILAGFTLPTQRAWLMVLVLVVFLLRRRQRQPWPILFLAAWLIVLWQPASVLAPGFWLSFLAVAMIFLWLGVAPKHHRFEQHPLARGIYQAWSIQWLISLGLIPGLWWFYQAFPTYSVLANLIAVPFVSFIGLPLVLITSLLTQLSYSLGWSTGMMDWVIAGLIHLADRLWSLLWWVLTEIAAWPNSEVALTAPQLWQVLVIYGTIFLWAAGHHQAWWWQKRKWISFGALILVMASSYFDFLAIQKEHHALLPGQARLTILDVGQGQAVIIETLNHRLIYDAGPRFGQATDAGERILQPFLKQRPQKTSQGLIISHADADHAGGLVSLREQHKFELRLSGEPDRLSTQYAQSDFSPCRQGQTWQWDNVVFELLAPGIFPVLDHNDASCVLSVRAGDDHLLLTGDLGQFHERALVRYYGKERLAARILLAGHHGSRHSSDPSFLSSVSPEWLVISAGYRNRFGMPHAEVIERVNQSTQAQILSTACSGAITFDLNRPGFQQPIVWRETFKRWFHISCDTVN